MVGRSELCELGLGLDVDWSLVVGESARPLVFVVEVGVENDEEQEEGKGGWGKLSEILENVSRNESGEEAASTLKYGEAGEEGDDGGEGAGRGAMRRVLSMENSYADKRSSPFLSMGKSTRLVVEEVRDFKLVGIREDVGWRVDVYREREVGIGEVHGEGQGDGDGNGD